MSREDADALGQLYGDILEAAWPDPELLARYATAPNELTEEERLEVERAMQRSPAIVDELDTLRGFDFSRLDADRRTATTPGPMASLVAWLSPARLAAVVGLAAALAIAVLVIQGREDPSRDEPTPIAEQPAPPEPPAPEGARSSPPVPEPTPELTPELELAQPESPTTPAAPDEPMRESPGPPPEASPRHSPETRLAEQPAPAEPAPTPEARPEPEREQPEMLLAMNVPRYESPLDAATRSFDGVYRSSGEAPGITLLAPAHVARSASRQPVLYWHVDRVPTSGGFYLSINGEDETDLVESRALPAVGRAGVQRTSLRELGIELSPGVEYRWSIALRSEAEAPPSSFGFGWVRVVAPDDAVRATLAKATAGERPDQLARAGYWYDALDATVALAEAHPDDGRPGAALAALLEQAGIELAEE